MRSAVAAAAFSIAAARCRFALDFTCADFLSNATATQSFMQSVMAAEGAGFHQPGIGYDAATGYTYDGHPLNVENGTLWGQPHLFSAPSKESVHLGMLALAVSGNTLATTFVGGLSNALNLLALKMAGYQAFNATYPGYGCFFPWVSVPYSPPPPQFANSSALQRPAASQQAAAAGIAPLSGWTQPYRLPGLDNGEMAWSVFAVAHALQLGAAVRDAAGDAATAARMRSLQADFGAWFDCMAGNAKTVFYAGGGNVSSVVTILNASAAPSQANYERPPGYLNDPYEGETLTVLLDLLTPWPDPAERELLWVVKRPMLQAVNYTGPTPAGKAAAAAVGRFLRAGAATASAGDASAVGDSAAAAGASPTITVGRGFWFSAHENWKAALLPYLRVPIAARVLANAERARTWDAALSGLPGLLASVNDVSDSESIPDYASACGVPSIAYQPITRRDLLTPYGSWMLMLHNRSVGLCYYRNMLAAPRVQGPHGSTEALLANGTAISPLTTWDSKITTLLTMAGGLGDLVADALALLPDQAGNPGTTALDRFLAVIDREYSMVFPSLAGEDAGFALPAAAVPDALSPWSTCE